MPMSNERVLLFLNEPVQYSMISNQLFGGLHAGTWYILKYACPKLANAPQNCRKCGHNKHLLEPCYRDPRATTALCARVS
jgi:hypothetical protein